MGAFKRNMVVVLRFTDFGIKENPTAKKLINNATLDISNCNVSRKIEKPNT